jgi:ATP-binding cassette subfamily C exporter for protease/lipase
MKFSNSQSEMGEVIASLWHYFRPAAWFSVFMSVLMLAPTVYMFEVYERVINSSSYLTLAMETVFVLGALVLLEVLGWTRAEIMREAGVALDRILSARVFDATFGANLKRLPGGSVQTMNDFRSVCDSFHSPAVLAVLDAPASLVFLIVMFAISPILGWATVAAALAQTLVGWLNERGTQPPLTRANRSAIEAQLYADGTLRHAQVIEAMGMLGHIHRRWMGKQNEFLELQAQASRHSGLYQALSKFVQTTTGSMLMGLGAWLLLNNQLGGGASFMIVGSVLGARVLTPLILIVSQWQNVINVRNSYSRLSLTLKLVQARDEDMPLPRPTGRLQVEDLIAGPPGASAPILKGLNFSLSAGQVLAVVGPSASGKTTLARLLVGLWPAANGKVRLDGADVYAWDKAELGPHIGYLPQGVELFEGSIASNIARFGPVDMNKVEAAARAVGLHEFISELPLGYDSPVGRDGAMLSGGQRQRVGLARAVYGNPVFVVLDEPNSSLDQKGDTALASAIQQLKSSGTTFVVMTHRTSVLAVADKMLVLREGQMQIYGMRDDVMNALSGVPA